MTNGVSFSLVTGALVAINYTNYVSPDTKNVTLNINSTGSKTLHYGRSSSGYGAGYYDAYLLEGAASVHIYTGSVYIAGSGISYRYYDYQD